jgi:transcriptional regulator with XRE-family HTH domain
LDSPREPESFRSLLLRHRGRSGLTQRDLAARAGVSLRSVQAWEAGDTLPGAERLQALIRAMLDVGGLTPGAESTEARGLWSAVERDVDRSVGPFDTEWFAGLLGAPPPQASVRYSLDTADRAQDWGEAPDTAGFVGRGVELALLQRWLLDDRRRLVTVLGMGGIGKTSLAAWAAHEAAVSFERVYCRSLRNAPPVTEWLAGAIGFLSDHRVVPPLEESEQIAALLRILRARRCLVVLDNSEALLEPGQREGRYRAGMDGYGRVLQAAGQARHQSCLVLTSREAPPELALVPGARALELHGLGLAEAQAMLADKQLIGDGLAWLRLVDRYGGNGLALKIVGETIHQVYNGDVAAFLAEAIATYGTVFGGVRRLLDVQAERLSRIERDVLMRMAVEREPIHLAHLSASMPPMVVRKTIIDAVETLRRRSLVERAEGEATFTLQSMVLEYFTDRLVETVAEEIERGEPVLLVEQPLMQARAKDYVRQTQERLIGAPIIRQLKADLTEGGPEQRLLALLDGWRGRPPGEQGYGPGNAVNLLRLLRGDLRGRTLSRLVLRQVYLQGVDTQDTTLVDSKLVEAVLAESFAYPTAVALSTDGDLLAAGTSTGEVRLWRAADRTLLLTMVWHEGTIWSVALSADGELLAVAVDDGGIRLIDTRTGQVRTTLHSHTGAVRCVTFSADGEVVASGGDDGTLRLWDVASGRLEAILEGHNAAVWGVALSGDGRLVAGGGQMGRSGSGSRRAAELWPLCWAMVERFAA